MQIDRYSRFVPVRDLHRGLTESDIEDSKARRTVLSVPRVKWLERDPEYVPPGEIIACGKFIEDQEQRQVALQHKRTVMLRTPPSKREAEVYRLRTEEKMAYAEIAAILKISTDAARSMYSRAVAKALAKKEREAKNEVG